MPHIRFTSTPSRRQERTRLMTTDKDLTSFHEGRERLAAARTQEVRDKAEKALADLLKAGERISVTTVAKAAGIGRTTLHGEAYQDIYDNIRQAMAEQPLPGSQRITRATTERGYQAKIMDLHQQLTEAKKQNEELILPRWDGS
jgi:4-hydroxy-3-methylbut-2-enyl diphosphate reductase IspH